MPLEKSQQEKTRLHSRNKNRERYDLEALIHATPKLADFVKPNKYGLESVDFSNPVAVKLLNKAILNHYYGINYWEFPEENLCPPIPGRADYIHHVADLLSENNFGTVPTGNKITCFDIGIGASCIYPIIGVAEYNWKFIGSDIDPKSIASAQQIVCANPVLKDKVECRLQQHSSNVFYGIVDKDDKIDLSVCNPPFHSSFEDALKGTQQKSDESLGRKNYKNDTQFCRNQQ